MIEATVNEEKREEYPKLVKGLYGNNVYWMVDSKTAICLTDNTIGLRKTMDDFVHDGKIKGSITLKNS